MSDAPDLQHIHPDLRALARPIGELNEDPANANQHSDRSLDGIAASFLKFGQRKPVVVRSEGMIVEAGNGALASLRRAGWTHLACVVCDDDEHMAKAYALADNRTAQLATWNYEQLAVNVQELLDDGFDCASLGWAEEDLQGLLEGDWSVQQDFGEQGEPGEGGEPSNDGEDNPNAAPDDPPDDPPVPPVPADPITQAGEVIQLGPHVLHCADCMDVMAGLADNSVDAIVTDPPYGLSPDGRARTWDDIAALRAEGKGPTAGFMGRTWDAGVPGITWARECLRVLKPGGHIVAFSATRTVHRLACAVEDAGFEIRDQMGWVTYQGFPKSKNMSAAIDEMMGVEREVVGRRTDGAGNTGSEAVPFMPPGSAEFDITAPATPAANTWDGFGTALKPAIEPAVIARKPLDKIAPEEAADLLGQDLMWSCKSATATATQPGDTKAIAAKRKASRKLWGDVPEGAVEWRGRPLRPGVAGRIELRVDGEVVATREGAKFSKAAIQTVALNVLKWGTGAINIDAGRHAPGDKAWPGPQDADLSNHGESGSHARAASSYTLGERSPQVTAGQEIGRWPANIYHCPKPATREREAGCEGVDRKHETVKPRGLFAQLLRLFVPPGGVVLEPFGGSGTTAVAAAGLDCSVIIAEMSPGYCDIIRARVEHSLGAPV